MAIVDYIFAWFLLVFAGVSVLFILITEINYKFFFMKSLRKALKGRWIDD